MALTASIVMAAGRGSRMRRFDGNKTLLPLVAQTDSYHGRRPILRHILAQLPDGPKAIVVHHRRQDVMAATRDLDVTYCEQSELNGTGGALLACGRFLRDSSCERVLVTMGDVPFVKPETYRRLGDRLAYDAMAILGFVPGDKRQYGVIERTGGRVRKITEWTCWRHYAPERQAALTLCNAGIYAIRGEILPEYLSRLKARPQKVTKEIDGRLATFDEYFITDLVQFMTADGLPVGCEAVDDPHEPMGVDDEAALIRAQAFYARSRTAGRASRPPVPTG